MSSVVEAKEQVKLDLTDSECSSAKVNVRLDVNETWVSNSVEFYGSADLDDQEVYLNIRRHTYTSVDGHEAISTNTDLMTTRFTRAEAEALLAVLSREVGKF